MSLFLVNTCSDTFAPHEFLKSFWNVLKTKTIERYYCYSHSSYSAKRVPALRFILISINQLPCPVLIVPLLA